MRESLGGVVIIRGFVAVKGKCGVGSGLRTKGVEASLAGLSSGHNRYSAEVSTSYYRCTMCGMGVPINWSAESLSLNGNDCEVDSIGAVDDSEKIAFKL